jgi:hypothetical protein
MDQNSVKKREHDFKAASFLFHTSVSIEKAEIKAKQKINRTTSSLVVR